MPADDPATTDRNRIALAIQQPWAELILRGIKTLEVRSQPTQLRGTIYVYASKRTSALPAAATATRLWNLDIETLPRGKVVGLVDVIDSRPSRPSDRQAACVPPALLKEQFVYQLDHPHRLDVPQPVQFLPYGVWFYPFKRRPHRSR
jgi:ASCH domain